MKRLISVGVLVAIALLLRFEPHSHVAIVVGSQAVNLNSVGFRFFVLLALVWLLILAIGEPRFYPARIKRER